MQRTSTEKELMLERVSTEQLKYRLLGRFLLKEGAAFLQLLLVFSGLEVKL
jgi:hypothetical protein